MCCLWTCASRHVTIQSLSATKGDLTVIGILSLSFSLKLSFNAPKTIICIRPETHQPKQGKSLTRHLFAKLRKAS